VINFKTDFRPSGFDRPVTAAFKDEIRSKLNIAGVVTLTVVFQRGPCGELVLHFEGPDEDVVKAKTAFDKVIDRSVSPADNQPKTASSFPTQPR
jgi:hypothetical protein